MVQERLIIYEYERILLGKEKNYSLTFHSDEDDAAKLKEIGCIWRYAISRILGWTPQEAKKYLTADIVDMLMLPGADTELIPRERWDTNRDWTALLQYAFPETFHYDQREYAINEWEHATHTGRWQSDGGDYEWPKSFFVGEDGITRASALLVHVRNLYLGDLSLEDIYHFFAKEKEAKRWLEKRALTSPLKVMYRTPIEYLHYSLPYREQDEFLYYNAIICEKVEQKRKAMARESRKVKKDIERDEDVQE